MVKKEEPKAETKTEESVAKKEIEPVKTEAPSENSIRKPVEISSGGGKTEAKAEAVKKEEPKPAVKTEPAKKEEPKAEVKQEPKPIIKTEPVKREEPKDELKTAPVKPLVKTITTDGGVIFKVQLFAVKNQPKDFDKISKTFAPISTELIPTGLTRYYTGNSHSIAEARKILSVAKSSGYPDAYIVGFKNGVRLSAEEMKTVMQ
mgnify:CR=1 FL=1